MGTRRKNEADAPGGDPLDVQLKKARLAAYRFLTGRFRSRKEVEEKIFRAGFSKEVVRRILDDLEEDNLLDDVRFSRNLAESLIRTKPCGASYVEHKLLGRGVDRDLARNTVRDLFPTEEEELETALSAARKKLRTLRAGSLADRRRKLAAHLSRKGFSSFVVRKACDTVLSDPDS
jgi:regulatory protein